MSCLINIIIYFFYQIINIMEPESEEQVQQKKNPIKRAQKQKQFRTAGQLKEVYTKPEALYEAAKKFDKTFKMVSNTHPKTKDLTIIDFSLNARGPDQDEIYVKQPFYRNNIRRGNTFVINNKQKKVYIARKGLKKFFDISLNSLRAIKQEDLMSLSKRDRYNHYSVFEQVQNVLSCNEDLEKKDQAKVHVYRLNKANGQNAQVSYFAPTKQWVISSKNVSIFIKDQKQIKLYDGQRYGFAHLIAQAWLKIVGQLNKNQLQALKEQLSGKTIVGEYCGNPDFQHLVKYSETTIYFYAMVQNQSQYTCIMPNQAFAFFQKYRIPIVKNYNKSYVGQFTKFTELGSQMLQIFKQVSSASIFEEEQGSVVYFGIELPKKFCEYVSDRYLQKTVPIPDNWQEKQVWQHVSTLGKLKTIEYRILRKLREKLKGLTRIKKKQDTAQNKEADFKKFQEKYGSFERQSFQLLKGQKLSKPIEYFFCIGLLAFQYIFKHKKSSKAVAILEEHYLDFLSVIFWSVEQKRPVTQQLMRDEQLHEKLRQQTWQNYSTQVINEYPQMLERIVPKYAKIKKTLKPQETEEQHGQQGKMEEKGQEDD